MGRNLRTSASSLAVVALSALTLLAPQSAAHAAAVEAKAASVEIVSPGGLYADGAVVVLGLKTRCAAGVDGEVYVEISQISSQGKVVTGSGDAIVTCTGKIERTLVPVFGSESFRSAEAFASADLVWCDDITCDSQGTARTVQLRDGVAERTSYSGDGLSYRLPKKGIIEAGGAGAEILVPYKCDPGLEGSFDAYLVQRDEQGPTDVAGAGAQLNCTAQNQSGVLAFHAQGTGWSHRDAFLMVRPVTCTSEFECSVLPATYRTIRLK